MDFMSIYKALQEMYGLELLKNVKFSGNSAGALFAACCAMGVGWKQAEKVYLEMADDGIKQGVFQQMSIYHNHAMDTVINNDMNAYKQLNNKLFVGLATWFDEYRLISSWDNNQELRDTLHASMHIPYYCTHIAKIRCNDGVYRRAIDGGAGKQFHRFGQDTLVITAMSTKGDIISDPSLTFMGDCYQPDLKKYDKMRDNGYKAMMEWDGKYKWIEYDNYTKSKYRLRKKNRKLNVRNMIVFIFWCLRILEDIKIKRIMLVILVIILYRKYGKFVGIC